MLVVQFKSNVIFSIKKIRQVMTKVALGTRDSFLESRNNKRNDDTVGQDLDVGDLFYHKHYSRRQLR